VTTALKRLTMLCWARPDSGALQSEDWGSSLEVSRGEISGEGLASQERPVKELMQMVKKLQRSTGVKFSGMAYVAARDQVPHPVTVVITKGRLPCFLVARSAIVVFFAGGCSRWGPISGRR